MTAKQKRELIWKIIEVLKSQAILHKKQFDAGDTFFTLAFRTDKEIKKIASLCGLK